MLNSLSLAFSFSLQFECIPINVSIRFGSNIFDAQSSNICIAIFIRSHLNGTGDFGFEYTPPIWLNLYVIFVSWKVLLIRVASTTTMKANIFGWITAMKQVTNIQNNNYHFKCKSALYDICIWLRPCNTLQTAASLSLFHSFWLASNSLQSLRMVLQGATYRTGWTIFYLGHSKCVSSVVKSVVVTRATCNKISFNPSKWQFWFAFI